MDDGNQRVLVRVDKNAEEPSNFTWTELVSEADFVFKRDGQSPQGIIHFLKALSKFDSVPDSCTPEEMQQFSILFQRGIVERISTFNPMNQLKIHFYACLILVKQFH